MHTVSLLVHLISKQTRSLSTRSVFFHITSWQIQTLQLSAWPVY